MAKKNDVKDTGFPGIKQRISNGKYVVTLDLGRQWRPNPKTGEMQLKQVKTTRTVSTLKEAKALQGKNNKEKKHKTVTGTTRKVPFSAVLDEYTKYYRNDWSDSYAMQKSAQAKRMKAFFGNRDVREIDTLDIEKFFKWCKEKQPGFPHELGENSIQKIKTHLADLWKFMKKNQSKYGVRENVVLDADYGEIEKYQATILTAEQVNYMLQFAINNEKDYSIFAMIGLPVLTGLRRGEVCGIRWGNIDYDNRRIDVEYQRCQISTGSIIKVPKGGKDEGKSREEKRQRYAALPNCLVTLLDYVKEQQEEYLQRKVTPDDYVYMTKTNLVNNYLPHPGKVSRYFSEFQKRMNKIRKKAQLDPIPTIRLHDLRHTFISLCLNGGINQFHVAANCGHNFSGRGSTTTISTYWHDDNNRDDIIEFIDNMITARLVIPDMSV
ncbi:MAG: site-specific integrase [Lachnospiraceae bacterium]|nr:site-specific integrase [Lachnospiraceae bacterium]